MFVGVGEMWGDITVTYHIINLGKMDDSGHLTSTRTEALKFTVSGPTVTVGNTTLEKYKSPLAKNWQYYSSGDVSYNTSTKVCTFTGGPSLTEESVLSAKADVYVTYELDEDAFSTVGVYDGGIFKIKFPNDLYLRQTMYGAEINTDSQPIPDPPTSEYLWKFNIVDPYQITIQSQSSSYLDYYLSNQTGKKDFANIRLQPTLAAAKGTYTWAFGLLSGGADGTYRLIVADGITASGNQLDSFGHGYLNNKRDNFKTTYHLYNTTSYERCDLTIEPLSVNYTFHIINNSGEEAMSKQTSSAENAGATIAESMIPDILKSPAACNYSFYPTAVDAAAGTNAITRLPVDPTDPINDDVYVRYETSSGGINLNGEIKYNLSVGGAHYLYAADATTINCAAASDAADTYRWRLLGGDPYKFTIENVDNNKFVTYDISGGEAVTLSETGSNFFLHQTTSGSYELVAIPSNDYPTSYYTLGYDGTLKLCSSTNPNHSFGDDEIKTVFTEVLTAIIDPLPTANDLTYNGLLQALVTAGTCKHGTIKYREGTTGDYGTTIPTKKYPGTYYVYYMSVGETGYEDYVAVDPIIVTIAPAPVTVTAENKTKVYGEADPALTATITGLITGESESLITYILSRTEDGENVGNYTITPDGDALQGNYEVSFVTGTLTIGKRTVGITWGETSFDYTGSPHVPTATATNLVYGDEIGITVKGEKTNVGNYTATASDLTGTKKGNYQLPAAAADKKTSFSIIKASINSSIEMTEWSYGDYDAETNSPSLSFNPDEAGVTYEYKELGADDGDYDTDIPINPGTYTIRATIAETSNHDGKIVTKDFTISPKALSKSASGRPANGITVTVERTGTTPPYNVTVTHNIQGVTTPLTPFDAEHPENPYDYTLSGESGVSGYVVTVTAKMEGDEYTGNYTGIVKAAYAEPTFYPDGAAWSPSGDEYAAVYLGLYDVLPSPVGGSEIKAYIVNKVNPTVGTITVSPVESPPTVTNYIPEDVPVLLLSNNENLTGFQISSTTEDTSDITAVAGYNNQLRIAPEGGVPVEDTEAYVFYRGEFVLTKKGTISPGKFFLYNPNYKASGGGGGGPSPVRRYLRIVMEEDEDPTGMDNGLQTAVNGPLNDLWYTLDGRRLDGKPTRKGIYITNGKKHIIK